MTAAGPAAAPPGQGAPATPWPATALILCGGRSARFGSDKALASFHGRPLLFHAVQAAQAAFAHVAVVAKSPQRYAALAAGAQLIDDGTAEETPLAGILAGLRGAPDEIAFAFAVDMPFAVHPPLLAALFAALPGHAAAAPALRGHLEPLCALWRRRPVLDAAGPLVDRGPTALLQALGARLVPFEDERPFLDADTPEALRELERR